MKATIGKFKVEAIKAGKSWAIRLNGAFQPLFMDMNKAKTEWLFRGKSQWGGRAFERQLSAHLMK